MSPEKLNKLPRPDAPPSPDPLLEGRRLILASDRGPFEYERGPDGTPVARRGRGGLVTALSPLTRLDRLIWIASAQSDLARRLARDTELPLPSNQAVVRLIVSPEPTYERFHDLACTALWFLQHQMRFELSETTERERVGDAWSDGYLPVDRAFAKAVVEEARCQPEQPLVMVHDLHLYLVAGMVREHLPDATIEHFVHVPWPPPRYWEALPPGIVQQVFVSMLRADIVGVQTSRDVQGFLDCCRAFLPGVQVDRGSNIVAPDDRSTLVKAYPASIDVDELRETAASPEVLEAERRLRPMCGDKTVVKIDRVDPTKNIVGGLRAFSLLLERRPHLVGRTRFLALLVPSGAGIPEYRRCRAEIDRYVEDVNRRFGQDGIQPVTVLYQHNYLQAIAAMCLYDVLLVNPIMDGMNLVAKEGPTVNARDGVLVLSRAAGAYAQLEDGAIPVDPGDVDGTAEALFRALNMPVEERKLRVATLRQAVERENARRWLTSQLQDLRSVADARSARMSAAQRGTM